jgi:hypothetical protein
MAAPVSHTERATSSLAQPATEARPAVRSAGVVPGYAHFLTMQSQAGNQATLSLAGQRQPVQGNPTPPGQLPADVNVGFNPEDIAHRLVEAIDQQQLKQLWPPQRHVDFPAVVAALSGRTTGEIQEIDRAYAAFEHRPLRVDLLGGGESEAPTDLTPDELIRVRVLLDGTRAAPGESALAAELNRLDADAAELHTLLHGDLSNADTEHVMTLLRRDATGNAALADQYQELFKVKLAEDLGQLGVGNRLRATLLLTGDAGAAVAADSLKVTALRGQVTEIDAKIAELTKVDYFGAVGLSLSHRIKELREQRRGIVADIEATVGQAGAEARQAALEQGDLAEPAAAYAAAEQAAKDRMRAVLGGDVEKAAADLRGADAAALRAVAADDPAARAAAHLHQLREADALTAAAITETLRGLREQAEEQTRQAMPLEDPATRAAAARSLAEDYLRRLPLAYDAGQSADAPTFERLVAGTGTLIDVILNQELRFSGGQLDPVSELRFALAGDRKDLETVKRVLRDKTAAEIKEIKQQFPELEAELFGSASTTAGDNDVVNTLAALTGTGGKASGADRLALEDYLQRPATEGGLEEARYISARAEREYQYAIDNRGFTGWWRDHWGNEARALMDESISNIRKLFLRFFTTGGTDSDALHQMRLWRATIRGDRAGYEKANAELRATFEMIASFALQVALAALLTPAAAAIFEVAEGAEAAALAVRAVKLARGVIVNTVSTVAANAAVQDHYGLDSLEHDLLGGLGSVIGSSTVGKLSGLLGNRFVSSLAGKEVISAASTLAGIEATAKLEGHSLTQDLSVRSFLLTHGMGKIAHTVTEAISPEEHAKQPGGAAEPAAAERAGVVEPSAPDTTGDVTAEPPDVPSRTSMALPDPAEVAPAEPARRPAEAPVGHAVEPVEASPGADTRAGPLRMTAAELTEFAAEVLRRPVRPMEGKAYFYDDVASYEAEFSRRFPGKKVPGGGYFDPNTGELHVSPRGNLLTVLHEAIHKVAEETAPLAKQLLGQYLNEGITEEITRARFGPRAGSHAYDRNVAFVELLQDRLGVDVVENAILHGDYLGFREAVRARLGGSEAETLEFMRLVGSVGPQSHDSPGLRAAIDLLDGRLTPRGARPGPAGAVPEEAASRGPESSEEPKQSEAAPADRKPAAGEGADPAASAEPHAAADPLGKEHRREMIADAAERQRARARRRQRPTVRPLLQGRDFRAGFMPYRFTAPDWVWRAFDAMPEGYAVYRVKNSSGKVIYVGITGRTGWVRWTEHLAEQGLEWVGQASRFEFLEVGLDTEKMALALEDSLMRQFKPRFNSQWTYVEKFGSPPDPQDIPRSNARIVLDLTHR